MERVVVRSMIVIMFLFSLHFFVLLLLLLLLLQLLRVHQQLPIMSLQPLQSAHTMLHMRAHARGPRVQPPLVRHQTPPAPPTLQLI